MTSAPTEKKRLTLPGRRALEQNVWDAARERMVRAYATFDHIAVAFSGGKDSTAILHVTLDVAAELGRLPVRVIFWDEECIATETDEYVRRVAERDDVELEWYCLPVKHRNACSNASPFWYPWAPEDKERWVRPLPPEAITEIDGFPLEPPSARWTTVEMNGLMFDPAKHGRVGFVFGIRAAESIRRQQAVTRREDENYIIPLAGSNTPTLRGPVSKVYPIYDWLTEDVWTAPRALGWDYNRAYDAQEMAGIGHASQRCAPPFGEEPMQKLWMWRECYPDLWEKMCERVPGAATAARYSTTELYEFRGTIGKQPDVTWEDHVVAQLEGFGADARAAAVNGIRRILTNHWNKTADPILPYARHPDSGVSWHEVAKLARRGDLKSRRSLIPGMDADKLARMAEEYDLERQMLEQQLGYRLDHTNCGQIT